MAYDTDSAQLAQPTYNPVAGWDPYPETEEGWRDLYDARWQMYLLEPYSAQVQKREHLFRAFDDSGNEIDQTRRLFGFYPFIVNVDARALAGGRLVLETHDRKPGQSKPAQLLLGEAVWRRSKLLGRLPLWYRMTCTLGDWWCEAVRSAKRKPFRTRIVGYDPRTVTPEYDQETGTILQKVTINIDYTDQLGGVSRGDTVHRYTRVLTPSRIEVTRNGKPVPEESGDHNLGVVPCVHLQAIPFDQPEHSLSAPAGVERAVMRLDSISTQFGAITNRYANPTLVTYGFKIGASSAVARFGRMIDGAPKDGKAEYLEAGLSQVPNVLEYLREITSHLRDTSPEFLFASDIARESAESRNLRGNAFEAKMEEMRSINHPAIAEVTAMAVAMDADVPFEVEEVPFRIDAPPILPRNVGVELDTIGKARAFIKRADTIRHLQRIGIVSTEHDPEAYAAEVADEQAARAAQFFDEEAGEPGEDPPAAPPGGKLRGPKPPE